MLQIYKAFVYINFLNKALKIFCAFRQYNSVCITGNRCFAAWQYQQHRIVPPPKVKLPAAKAEHTAAARLKKY